MKIKIISFQKQILETLFVSGMIGDINSFSNNPAFSFLLEEEDLYEDIV